MNQKELDTPDLYCTDRETSPETARDSSEVPQSAELGLGLRWYLSTPLSPVSTATSKNSHLHCLKAFRGAPACFHFYDFTVG